MRIEFLADHPGYTTELAGLHFEEWNYLRPGESLEERTERLRASSGKTMPAVIIAIIDRELVGSAMLVENDLTSRTDLTPWLAGVYVKPQYRGRGIAKALVSRVAELAASQSFTTIYLYTPTSSLIYEKWGWNIVDRSVQNGMLVCVMARSLTR